MARRTAACRWSTPPHSCRPCAAPTPTSNGSPTPRRRTAGATRKTASTSGSTSTASSTRTSSSRSDYAPSAPRSRAFAAQLGEDHEQQRRLLGDGGEGEHRRLEFEGILVQAIGNAGRVELAVELPIGIGGAVSAQRPPRRGRRGGRLVDRQLDGGAGQPRRLVRRRRHDVIEPRRPRQLRRRKRGLAGWRQRRADGLHSEEAKRGGVHIWPCQKK